jgi:predicted GNAT family acetyltransferase
MASEAEHNLILGMADALISGDHPYSPPLYLAWVEDAAGEVRGIAFRTPPFKVGVSELPRAAVPALAADLAEVFDSIPAVMGPEGTARRLATAWAEPRGLAVEMGMRLRIHSLTEVRAGLRRSGGAMDEASAGDVPLVARWLAAFADDTGIPDTDPGAAARRLVDAGRIRLWKDGDTVSMAALAGLTPTSARVGYVYTPPLLRGRGYATALVADMSTEMLASGRRSAFLYTDLANPTSNAIYARIGYEPVCDVADVEIVEPSTVDRGRSGS